MKLGIYNNDKEYAHVLAKALSKELKGCEIEIEPSTCDYAITGQLFKSVGEICEEIEAACPGASGRPMGKGKCDFICFCSANGGSGVSATSLTFARQLSRLDGKRVFYLNTTPIAFLPEKDEYGVHSVSASGLNPVFDMSNADLISFMNKISDNYDCVVIDTSYSLWSFRTVFGASEKTVVVFSPGRGCTKTETLFQILTEASADGRRKIIDFRPEFDEFSFSGGKIDIHGGFGAEVRTLVSKLE